MSRTQHIAVRRGFTLVELLVVIGVLSVLAAIALPTVREVIVDARASESIRNVRSFLEDARAKAILTGRSHGVVFERRDANSAAGRGEISLLRMVSAAPDYTGDTEQAGCWLYHDTDPLAPVSGQRLLPNAAVFDFADCISLVASATFYSAGTGSAPIRVGDTMILSGRRLVITRIAFCDASDPPAIDFTAANPKNRGSLRKLVAPGLATSWVKVYFDPRSVVAASNQIGSPEVPPLEPSFWPTAAAATHVNLAKQPFRIQRHQLRGGGTQLRLARNSCIDSYLSGIGVAGTQFSPYSINAAQTNSTSVADYGPIEIVFDRSGAVELVYTSTLVPVGASGDYTYAPVATKPHSTIYMLVGKTARVRPDQIGTPDILDPSTWQFVQLPNDDEFCNLFEGDAGWITINPFSGRVRVSDLSNVEPTYPVGFTAAVRSARETAQNVR